MPSRIERALPFSNYPQSLLRTGDRSVTPAATPTRSTRRRARRSRSAPRLSAATAAMIRRRRPLHSARSFPSALPARRRSFIPAHSRRTLSPICRPQGRRSPRRPVDVGFRPAVRRSSRHRHTRRPMLSHIVIHVIQIPQRPARHSQPGRVLLKHKVPLAVLLRHDHRRLVRQDKRLSRRSCCRWRLRRRR